MDYKKLLRRKRWCMFWMILMFVLGVGNALTGEINTCMLCFIFCHLIMIHDNLEDLKEMNRLTVEEYKPLGRGELDE